MCNHYPQGSRSFGGAYCARRDQHHIYIYTSTNLHPCTFALLPQDASFKRKEVVSVSGPDGASHFTHNPWLIEQTADPALNELTGASQSRLELGFHLSSRVRVEENSTFKSTLFEGLSRLFTSELVDPPLIVVAHQGIPDHENLGPRRLWCRVRKVPGILGKRSEHRGLRRPLVVGTHSALGNVSKHPERLDEWPCESKKCFHIFYSVSVDTTRARRRSFSTRGSRRMV